MKNLFNQIYNYLNYYWVARNNISKLILFLAIPSFIIFIKNIIFNLLLLPYVEFPFESLIATPIILGTVILIIFLIFESFFKNNMYMKINDKSIVPIMVDIYIISILCFLLSTGDYLIIFINFFIYLPIIILTIKKIYLMHFKSTFKYLKIQDKLKKMSKEYIKVFMLFLVYMYLINNNYINYDNYFIFLSTASIKIINNTIVYLIVIIDYYKFYHKECFR